MQWGFTYRVQGEEVEFPGKGVSVEKADVGLDIRSLRDQDGDDGADDKGTKSDSSARCDADGMADDKGEELCANVGGVVEGKRRHTYLGQHIRVAVYCRGGEALSPDDEW